MERRKYESGVTAIDVLIVVVVVVLLVLVAAREFPHYEQLESPPLATPAQG